MEGLVSAVMIQLDLRSLHSRLERSVGMLDQLGESGNVEL